MEDNIISRLEILIRTISEYVEEGKEKEGINDFQNHFSSVEKNIIDLARAVSDLRSFEGTNPHLLIENEK